MIGFRIPTLTVIVCVTLVAGLRLVPVQALPPDPQRPFVAQTCAEAMARHAEALAGSSLISQAENAAVLVLAGAQVARLCEPKAGAMAPETPRNRPKGLSENAISPGSVRCQH